MFSYQKPPRYLEMKLEMGSLPFWMVAELMSGKQLVFYQAMVMAVFFVQNYCQLDAASGKTLCWFVIRSKVGGCEPFSGMGDKGPAAKPASPHSRALPGTEKCRRSKSQEKHCEICPAKYCFSKKSIFQRWHWRSICYSLKYEIYRVGRPQTKFIASGKDPRLNSP